MKDQHDDGDRSARLQALRAEMARRGLDGFVVPRADEHQGEYVAPCSERLAWLTGFTGSAGTAVVMADKGAVFVDGRYTLQAATEVDAGAFEIRHVTEEPLADWVAGNLPAGGVLGYDPWLHTPDGVARLEAAAAKAGGRAEAVEGNPLDTVWGDRPPPPSSPVVPHDPELAGMTYGEKRGTVVASLEKDRLAAAVISAPDALAWLFNLRGSDIPHTPVALGFAVVEAEGAATLVMDTAKVGDETRRHLGETVSVEPREALATILDRLGKAGGRVRIDQATCPAWIASRLRDAGAEVDAGLDPCALPKARKNAVELEGIRRAHERDGAALTRFLAWLSCTAPEGGVTELSAAAKLEALRREDAAFRDLSFDTISGAGEHGAVVHYRVSEASDRPLNAGELYLVDSGAQYPDGTTDVTRTVAVGVPTDEMRTNFTRVLKGHIAMASTRFPKGTSGSQLDVLARHALWQAGLDYDHGTGHGVGCFLAVHEGPQRISKLPSRVALEPGMVVSNEPGYYKAGEYGIRIENLVCVVELPKRDGWERDMLGFETLTLAPVDRALIRRDMLSDPEIAWLDAYHARVLKTLAPRLDPDAAAWLAGAAASL